MGDTEEQRQIDNLPRHIAIIMDGNGRWAKKRFLPRVAGHRAGLEAAKTIIRVAVEKNIDYLTLFAFSTENWRRPLSEVNALMDLFFHSLKKEVKVFHENNIRLKFIGDINGFNQKLQTKIIEAMDLTSQNTGMTLVIAANYGGRWDIVEAVQSIVRKVSQGIIKPSDITEVLFQKELSTVDMPDPDLFIRTSGEQRTSNFLNWQLAYTELYFTETYWPEFGEEHFEKALTFYEKRQRRFGYISEQVERADA